MVIEKATVLDAEEILALQRLAFKSVAEGCNDFSIPSLTQTIEQLKSEFEYQEFLKAIIDGRIIGSARASEKDGTCYIGRVIVHPDFQGGGIGSKIMLELEAMFKDCKRFELFTGEESKKNICFYQKLGYEIFKAERFNAKVSLVYLEKCGMNNF